jgi:Concanavalin A-like lectin/glucanases superfamily
MMTVPFKKCCLALSILFGIGDLSICFSQDVPLKTPKQPLAADSPDQGASATLVAHWPLLSDTKNRTETKLLNTAKGVAFESVTSAGVTRRAARFNGRDSVIETGDAEALKLGTEAFSIAAWVNVGHSLGDSVGDLISQFDYDSRKGFHLGIYSHGGVTNSQPNVRQLHFGIDSGRIDSDGSEPVFKDHGQIGEAVYVFSLCVHRGRLYASTCSAGKDQAGHVYRFAGEDRWTDLGSPDKANSISAMATFNGQLYVASSKYRLAGSSLSESENPNFGGSIFRLTDDDQWENCGNVSPETEAIASLIVYRGQLYASSLYRPAGFFRYGGDKTWTACPTPDGKRIEAMTLFNDSIFATCYDEGSVFRFDGNSWETVGKIPGATQTYGFGVYRGELYVSEWPQAHVFKYLGGINWEDVGKLGQELEAMPLLVYNGKMYGGTLPTAEVYRFDELQKWTKIGRVDHTPDVKYRRAWSMAVYQGRLFVGTLPSGRVLSIEAGRNVTHDHELDAGWHHIVAIRDVDRLRLFVDGKSVGESARFDRTDFDLSSTSPLRIGFGAQDYLDACIADLRIYRGVLSSAEIAALALPEKRN